MDNKWIIITGTSLFPDHKRQWIMCPYCKATYHIWMKNKRKCDICGNKVKGTITEEEYMKKENDDFSERVDDILRQMDADYEPVKAIPSAEPKTGHWIKKPYLEPLPMDCLPSNSEDYDEETHSIKSYKIVCDKCGWRKDWLLSYNFCPNCGADMREEVSK